MTTLGNGWVNIEIQGRCLFRGNKLIASELVF